jgi:enamine deaminase RidA (YjgF/YER057c/UK114 family)
MIDRYHDQAPPGLAAAPGYSHVVSATGRLVVVAGQVAIDELGAVVGSGDLAEQAEQVFKNIGYALAAARASFNDVIKLNYYLIDISQLPSVRLVRDRYVDMGHPPAATAVEVKGLFRPELLLEVDAIAIVREG